jgi:hypothetical protein
MNAQYDFGSGLGSWRPSQFYVMLVAVKYDGAPVFSADSLDGFDHAVTAAYLASVSNPAALPEIQSYEPADTSTRKWLRFKVNDEYRSFVTPLDQRHALFLVPMYSNDKANDEKWRQARELVLRRILESLTISERPQ